jgi:glyoxylase-like metal-dependent hydrolase (beta-lactamase superfamily II)
MPREFDPINRRLFIARLGKGTMALAILGACGEGGEAPRTTSEAVTSTIVDPGTTAAVSTTTGTPSTTAAAAARYLRVNLGFVSAYIVIRGSEAAVVDTGVAGSEGAIATALGEVDLGWEAVGHLILTHHHGDHVGSMAAVLEAASQANGYIGAEDLDDVASPRDLMPVNDGDEIFGLQVIHTPGHTDGHISLLDPVARVLVAGDAINGADGGVAGPNPQFSADHDLALESMAKLTAYDFDTIYFGHGEPVLTGAAGRLRAAIAGDGYGSP